MENLILVSGVRLSNKGLHLGHYLGSFTPLKEIMDEYNFYFVVNDVSNIELTKKDKEDSLLDMLSDILAIETPKNIRIFLQSDILKHQSNFFNKILKLTTFNQLIAAHPHKDIRSGSSSLTVLDYLFPMRDAVVYLSLQSDYVLMNDDNSRIIDFTRKISRKMNNLLSPVNGKTILKSPHLRTGFIPRIFGYDYKKMCNGNNNAIYLTEDSDILEKKVSKLFNTTHFNTFIKSKFEDVSKVTNLDLNKYYLPNSISKLFDDHSTNFNFEKNSNGEFNLVDNPDIAKSRLFKLLDNCFYRFKAKKEVFVNKKELLQSKLRDDSYYLESLMQEFNQTLI